MSSKCHCMQSIAIVRVSKKEIGEKKGEKQKKAQHLIRLAGLISNEALKQQRHLRTCSAIMPPRESTSVAYKERLSVATMQTGFRKGTVRLASCRIRVHKY